jgi:PTS system beta-glucosides-specific IIC component
MDTVNLDGRFFETKVKQGDQVKQGEVLLTFDKEEIEEAGYSLVTPIVVTNTSAYLDVIADDNRGAITIVK